MKSLRMHLLVIMILGLLLSICVPAFAVQEGSCGPNATWRFEDGTLTISGTGVVASTHWYDIRNNITKVIVEPGIISLPDDAFHDCEFLTDISLPEGLIQFGSYAFSNCHSLGTVLLPSTLKTIGEYAFGNSGLTGITIPGSVERIGVGAFDNCYKLMRVTLEEGITTIGASVFYDCKRLTDVFLPDSLDTIENNAFENCTALRSIVLPENLKVIPSFAFQGCESLEHVTLSPRTTGIEYGAFFECPSLRSIEIPASVQRIHGLPNTLQEVHISDLAAWCQASHNSYDHCLERAGLYLNGELITDLVIPDGCKSISDFAFNSYGKLKSVTFPEGVTTIGSGAFSGCYALEQITLPKTIRIILDFAFDRTDNLNRVKYNGAMEDMQNIEVYGGNDSILNASWQVDTTGSFQTFSVSMTVSMLISCLVTGGIFVACLVIFIRQKLNPFG